MKSFEQFEYEKSLMDESIVGTNVGQRFQRGNTSSAEYANMISGTKKPTSNKLPPNTVNPATKEKTTEKVKVVGTGGVRQEPQGPKAPSIPTRPGRRSDGSKKTGVAATIERNKARATDFAKSERGKKIGRTVGGALGAARAYKPDGEAVDTGASGMGTQMRHLRGIGAAAMDGAIKGYQNRTKDAKKDGRNISGSGTQKGGTTASRGLFGVVGDFVKDRIKKKVGIDSKKTAGGKTITGDVESKYRRGQQERQKQRDQETERKTPKKETQASKDATKSPSVTGSDQPTGDVAKSRSSKETAVVKQADNILGKDKPKQREIDKQIETAKSDTAARDQAKKDFEASYGKGASLKSDEKKPSEAESKVKSLVKGAESESKARKKVNDAPPKKGGVEGLLAAMKKQEESEKKKETKKETKTVKATTVPKKPKEEKPKEQKLKRPNIRSYKGDLEGYEKARAAYNAQKPENKTKVGNQGRPKKEETKPATRGDARRQLNKVGREITAKQTEKNKKEVKEATGRIAMMRAAKEQGKTIKTRTYSQMKKDEAREAAIKRIQNEQFSHWREEFLWEVDKKYPDKVKEIKPMSGKNTIIINPEDESAKYKRGY